MFTGGQIKPLSLLHSPGYSNGHLWRSTDHLEEIAKCVFYGCLYGWIQGHLLGPGNEKIFLRTEERIRFGQWHEMWKRLGPSLFFPSSIITGNNRRNRIDSIVECLQLTQLQRYRKESEDAGCKIGAVNAILNLEEKIFFMYSNRYFENQNKSFWNNHMECQKPSPIWKKTNYVLEENVALKVDIGEYSIHKEEKYIMIYSSCISNTNNTAITIKNHLV